MPGYFNFILNALTNLPDNCTFCFILIILLGNIGLMVLIVGETQLDREGETS